MALSKTGNASSIFSFRFDTRYCVYPYMENSSRITRMIFRALYILLKGIAFMSIPLPQIVVNVYRTESRLTGDGILLN